MCVTYIVLKCALAYGELSNAVEDAGCTESLADFDNPFFLFQIPFTSQQLFFGAIKIIQCFLVLHQKYLFKNLHILM